MGTFDKTKLDKSHIEAITKTDIGLGNIDNTSDLDKPISTAVGNALNTKVDKVTGKGLTSNDLTDNLKSNYDSAVSNSHSHNNFSDLNNISGINTGDETTDSIKSKLGITILSGNNTGDQDLSNLATTSDLSNKVDKVTGKGLSTNDLTDDLKSNYDTAFNHSQSEHAPIDAEKNVQADWNQEDDTNDSFIKNKPTFNISNITKVVQNIGDGLNISITINHNLGTLDTSITVFEKTTGAVVYPEIVNPTINSTTFSFSIAPTVDQYRVVIIG